MRSDISYGNGMYSPTDGGKTWTRIGLEDTRQIGRILVDPPTRTVVFVAALGHGYGPNAERGVFRSQDGGKTWTKVLFKDENTGAIDLAFEPGQRRRRSSPRSGRRGARPGTSTRLRTGPGSGLYRSADGGDTWKRRRRTAFPPRSSAASASRSRRATPKRVYAIVDARRAGSTSRRTAARSWKRASGDRADLGTRLVLRRRDRRSEEPRRGLRLQHGHVPLDRRRQDVRADQGSAGRRRLPPALDRPDGPRPHDPRRAIRARW